MKTVMELARDVDVAQAALDEAAQALLARLSGGAYTPPAAFSAKAPDVLKTMLAAEPREPSRKHGIPRGQLTDSAVAELAALKPGRTLNSRRLATVAKTTRASACACLVSLAKMGVATRVGRGKYVAASSRPALVSA